MPGSTTSCICMDMAYSEIYYDAEYLPPSILQVPGAKDVAIEFHSFSKPYNMTGWRLGWACGNPEALAALNKLKSNVDSGAFRAIQEVGAIALLSDTSEYLAELRAMYRRRRDLLVDGLNPPAGTCAHRRRRSTCGRPRPMA